MIITAIVLVLGLVIGYTIDFQTGYRSGRIQYKEIEKDSTEVLTIDGLDELEASADSVKTECADSVESCHGASLQNETTSEK